MDWGAQRAKSGAKRINRSCQGSADGACGTLDTQCLIAPRVIFEILGGQGGARSTMAVAVFYTCSGMAL
jgi:hypothetical protein